MQRLKHDECRLLAELRAGAAGFGTPSSGRRASLVAKFTRRGWVRDGKLSRDGDRMARLNPPPQIEDVKALLPPIAEAALELEPLGEAETILFDERQGNVRDEGDFQRFDREKVDDPA